MTLFDLPDPDTLYAALCAKDPAYDGRAYVAVRSTGIFCRFTCPARKPLRKNCAFHATAGACLEAGFRPCKRCHPLNQSGDPLVETLLAALDRDPARRWREADLLAMGHDPSTVRRAFKRHFGMSFLDIARQRRLREGFTALGDTGSVTEAQLDAGFESPSAFRASFARLLGVAPGSLTAGARLQADWIDTALGPMVAVSDEKALYLLEFADRKALPAKLRTLWRDAKGDLGLGRPAPTARAAQDLAAFMDGSCARFTVPLAPGGTPFQRQVWDALQRIPAGETRSYSDLATRIGRPEATRAVARANGANRIAILIPCHRVIGADGSLTGYGGGLWRKRRLIDIERHYTGLAETA
ncbi:bifunctional transcriptional activator/DNA repair enzyme AdaA [Nioella sp.]|uniref:bifunctional transcriptional activator/DNA repair enzyme AdaA n=1 Tax=Nioella sp. TaxID=1912091 RepID=UPI003A85BEFF